jgi:3-methyl-2-oxobutanoate hydroxymethyltransferase
MSTVSIDLFKRAKLEKQKLKMVTCYDASMAKIVATTNVDTVLVGDSVAMVQHGFDSTIHATMEMMVLHTSAVARGLGGTKFLVADLPFTTFRKGKSFALDCASELICAGAHAVKLEGLKGHEDVVEHLVDSGVPVMGHVGLTPQLALALGGHKVQGREASAVERLSLEARDLEKLGVFSLVLECVPSTLGARISSELKIPTIGIGAGADTDGQVLVFNDMLGMNGRFKPKFLRRFAELESSITLALNEYCKEVDEGTFPTEGESYA